MSLKKVHINLLIILNLVFMGCMKDDEWVKSQKTDKIPANGLFILNEGNFMYGNSSISFYDPKTRVLQNDIFTKVNGLPLGDVAQSMSIVDNLGYIVINNSGKIYVIDTSSGQYIGKITGLTSPRYIHISQNGKGYVSDLYAEKITIVNPKTFQITGSIPTTGHASTEQMVEWKELLFVSCWSFDNTILVIDTRSDKVVGEIKTGKQPGGLVLDKYNKIWTLCDGGWVRNGLNARVPMLQRIDPLSLTIERSFTLATDGAPSRLAVNGSGDSLIYINNGIWRMGVNQLTIDQQPFISSKNHIYYSLAVDPHTSELYLSDAIDYQQQGVIYRYSPIGLKVDSFKTGIIPGSYCFK